MVLPADSRSAKRSWLNSGSVEAVRAALAVVAPEIADEHIELQPWVDNREEWHRNSARVGHEWVVKFAWSEPAAAKLEREIDVLLAVATSGRSSPLRRISQWSIDPVLFVAPYVLGEPVNGDLLKRLTPEGRHRLTSGLAASLADLHDEHTRAALDHRMACLATPTPQAGTDELRDRLSPRLDQHRRSMVTAWCDWADAALASPCEDVVLHGDFHGYNVVSDDSGHVHAVLDLEEASFGDFHYDFRYLPGQESTLALFLEVVEAYEARTDRRVSLDRVMGWHVRTVLGDALWRTEAGVELPEGGSVIQWIDEIAQRFDALGIVTSG